MQEMEADMQREIMRHREASTPRAPQQAMSARGPSPHQYQDQPYHQEQPWAEAGRGGRPPEDRGRSAESELERLFRESARMRY